MFASKKKRSFDRDAVSSLVFCVAAVLIAMSIAEREPPDTRFWICCGIAALCLIGAKHWWAPVGTTALYVVGPLLGIAVMQRRADAAVGAGICAGIIGLTWWFAELPGRRAREAFAEGKYCPACNRAVRARALQRPIIDDAESDRHWFYPCGCGESLLFDPSGNAERLALSPPSSSGQGSAGK